MMRNMIIDRMKLGAHVEEQERTTFALVVARSDGRLGPNRQRSTRDCSQPSAPPVAPLPDPQKHCGMKMGLGMIESGGLMLDELVRSLGGLAGGRVTNRRCRVRPETDDLVSRPPSSALGRQNQRAFQKLTAGMQLAGSKKVWDGF